MDKEKQLTLGAIVFSIIFTGYMGLETIKAKLPREYHMQIPISKVEDYETHNDLFGTHRGKAIFLNSIDQAIFMSNGNYHKTGMDTINYVNTVLRQRINGLWNPNASYKILYIEPTQPPLGK